MTGPRVPGRRTAARWLAAALGSGAGALARWADRAAAGEPGALLVPFGDEPRRPIRRLLVTGAAGGVAAMLRPALAERYPVLRLTDARPVAAGRASDEVVQCDLADRAALARVIAGCDAVLHLGAVAKEAPFGRLAPANLAGVHHLFELAVEYRVRRVVLASTMHVLGLYARGERVTHASPPRPDGLYAASKLFAEALGRVHAAKYGLEVACLRIGHAVERSEDAEPGSWIGPRDLAALAITMLEHPDVRFEVVHAVAPHAGDLLGQSDVARRFGVTWHDAGPSYVEALARVPARFPNDPRAQTYRGGVFASAAPAAAAR